MVTTPNIKINTSMINDFETPVSNSGNQNTYLRINENNKIDYFSIDELIKDINDHGGTTTSGDSKGNNWEPSETYVLDDIVVYNYSFYQCRVNKTNKEEFDPSEWILLAGYSKQSFFYYNSTEEISQIVLDEPVANKGSFNINVNNLLLQSNNYNLELDNKTITFLEPIAPDTNVEVIVYGNMIIPTEVSNIVTKTFLTVEDTTTFELGEIVNKKELITVNIENTVLMNSEWDLDETLSKVVLKNSVPKNTRVQISFFNNLELKLGATFTPTLTRDDNITTTISWENDGGLINPVDSYIYDGVTFTPHTSKTGVHTTISWTNNGEKENPEDVIVSDGATFTPTVSKEGLNTTITWDNDNGLPNPDTVVIEDGATFTPHTTQTAHEATISFTNNKDLDNPETISIYTNYAQRIVESFTATEGQTEFVASHEIYDKSVLSVNVGNTELTSAAYSLGEDKRTVTLVNGLSEGDLVDIKYFYNLNFGTEGSTYAPQIEEIENGYTLSWTNNGDLPNPDPVNIMSGSGINAMGAWSAETIYNKNDYVTFDDDTASYGYVGLVNNIPAGTELTDTTKWSEMYKILKTYIAATMIDWGE